MICSFCGDNCANCHYVEVKNKLNPRRPALQPACLECGLKKSLVCSEHLQPKFFVDEFFICLICRENLCQPFLLLSDELLQTIEAVIPQLESNIMWLWLDQASQFGIDPSVVILQRWAGYALHHGLEPKAVTAQVKMRRSIRFLLPIAWQDQLDLAIYSELASDVR